MTRPEQNPSSRIFGLAITAGIFILVVTAIAAQAQTFTVLHEFTGGTDGSGPYSTLVMDHSGNLYGIATYGAHSGCGIYPGVGCGTVFKLKHGADGWVFYPLYGFTGAPDGANPVGSLTIAPDGTLYGTTNDGGTEGDCTDNWGRIGCGTVFHLQPPPNICSSFLCPWNETVLYRFPGGNGGNDPWAGVVLDGAGNLYGTAYQGGANHWGVAYQVSPSGSGWTESTIHAFAGGDDGGSPTSALVFDESGNLYGTTELGGGCGAGGDGCGTIFQLTPSGSGWNANILYNFAGEDSTPFGGVIFDPAGNLYGSFLEVTNGVFELSPSNGNWNFTQLYSQYFGGLFAFYSPLARDAAGNLYGTAEVGGDDGCNDPYGCGFVYELTPSAGGWTYTQLYAFTGGADGAFPYGGVVVDASGNIYGTAAAGGTNYCTFQGCGTVWEISP